MGSLNFAAVISWSNIIFSISKLAQFLTNLSAVYLAILNRVIFYLYVLRNLIIKYLEYDNGELFKYLSDAVFIDDLITCRSFDEYLFKLYQGAINWRAARQKTVTILSIEVEFLSLFLISQELLWWGRFFRAIQFNIEQQIIINCDN